MAGFGISDAEPSCYTTS